jgi:deoxycytidylate deaminase
MKYLEVTGGVSYAHPCNCPRCDGHVQSAIIEQVVYSEDGTTDRAAMLALTLAKVPQSAEWDYGPHISDVTLREVERAALTGWNSGKSTASPLALAHARGEI